MNRRPFHLGTRKTPLALRQAEIAQQALLNAGIATLICPYQTTGDQISKPLRFTEGKGLFVKELEQSLLEKKIDMAVHSYKDMPYLMTEDLVIACVLPREDPRDAFLSTSEMKNLPHDLSSYGGVVGTCSLRRHNQIKHTYPHIRLQDIRGGVNTRIQKMDNGDIDGLILAMAGLKRLHLTHRVRHIFSTDELIPAPTQGILAIQCRKEDLLLQKALKACNHDNTQKESCVERGFVTAIEGDCQTSLGGYAHIHDTHLTFLGMLSQPDGTHLVTLKDVADLAQIKDFLAHGYALGHKIRRMHHEEIAHLQSR
ncbi:hydroxymethylbilane synthase [Candidatus Hepatobacter penaei]|uniref:hydroxymethylbilane synthase n=1 Tax=Candidatus Hepatobacter penaei TaxID=1274402 RepID=UPI000696CE90|nr:hydroxymethylbilane synthase [Candidatus Hepatobacter penaei]TGW14942.1 hydroxymethylbilane synthase [bacterium NHP-B]